MSAERPEPVTEEIIPGVGERRQEWCPHCCRTTLVAHSIYAITSQGSHVIGEYAICEECGWSPYAKRLTP